MVALLLGGWLVGCGWMGRWGQTVSDFKDFDKLKWILYMNHFLNIKLEIKAKEERKSL